MIIAITITEFLSNDYNELHWIMYSVLSVALAFLLYSLFILYGLKEKEVEVKKED